MVAGSNAGGQDTVGGSIGEDIVAGALKDLGETTCGAAASASESDPVELDAVELRERPSGIDWERPTPECIDVFDAVNEWWTPSTCVANVQNFHIATSHHVLSCKFCVHVDVVLTVA